MDDASFSNTIELGKSLNEGNPQERIDSLISFARMLNDNNNEYAEEIVSLEQKLESVNKVNANLFSIINTLRNSLNQLHDAHAMSWLGQECHCDAHQKAYGVLMDIAMWESKNN